MIIILYFDFKIIILPLVYICPTKLRGTSLHTDGPIYSGDTRLLNSVDSQLQQ